MLKLTHAHFQTPPIPAVCSLTGQQRRRHIGPHVHGSVKETIDSWYNYLTIKWQTDPPKTQKGLEHSHFYRYYSEISCGGS